MWILLTVKLPTKPSPPKLSIFWSTPWPHDEYARRQSHTCLYCGRYIASDDGTGKIHDKRRYNRMVEGECECEGGPVFPTQETTEIYDSLGMKEPNWIGARMIHYADQDIRVFPHEFSVPSPENLKLYIFGDSCSHELVSETAADEILVKGVLDSDNQAFYDAALLDGCTPNQALMTALGMDITLPDSQVPPIGWYKIKPEYGAIFCTPEEMEENREIAEETPEQKPKRKSRKHHTGLGLWLP